MSEGKNILDIRVKLKGEVRTRFLQIKSAKGLTNNTEVLRLIINEYFQKNLAKEPNNVEEFLDKKIHGVEAGEA